MRKFKSGATRDTEDGKIDIEGHLSPLALMRYCSYMHKHRKTAEGIRASDDWQKGMPLDVYMKSLLRHVFDVWGAHRQYELLPLDGKEDALCGVIFNALGMLHEIEKEKINGS
jgi:hypothetical protein